jgi:iron complex outermembrane recepter protein
MNRAWPGCFLALISALLDAPFTAAADAADAAAQTSQVGITPIVITATREQAQDYRVEHVDSLGPLGTVPLLDAPYSVGVLPLQLIEDSQAVNFKELSKYLPLVAYQEQQGPDILRPQTRGIQGGNFQNTRLDGMTMFITVAMAMEQFQQIEVVNGPTSSLFGPANPSGMFNFVSKRPTDYRLDELSATYNSDSIGTVHADLGGPIDKNGIFSYRVNALYDDGDGYVDRSHQRRGLGDVGLDIRPWESTVLELNYSEYSLHNKGYPGWFTYGEKIQLPAAPDPTRVGYGQSYAGIDLWTQLTTARIKHDFSSNWHFVAGILNQDATRNINTPVNNLTSSAGNYTSSFANGFAPRFAIVSDTAYLNGSFETWGMGHNLTIGTAGYKARSFSVITPASAASVRLGSANIYDPMIFPEPAAGPPNVRANYDSSDTYQQGINISDEIRLTRYWALRAGFSQDWFHVKNYSAKGTELPEYSNQGVSPTGSILFKPLANMTAYFTYTSSLQAGDLAPGTAANAGVSLPPYRSKEYELGYKADLAKIAITAALFRIERPFANIDPANSVFEISGLQVNKGLELSAIGEIATGLRVYAGMTLLDARLEHTPLPSTNDQHYVGAPKFKGNSLFEYDIPGVRGLSALFDYQFTGTRPANDANTVIVAGYSLFDLGGRYRWNVMGKPATFRLSVDNIANRDYWSTIGPSNLTGANTGSLLAHLGSPRTVLASISLRL